ncbi:NrsF family protein [Noviherbaspirillum sedimenti]|uniref:DUF1109 domain-containing protein n=1 Tax=Noviherbaspirillum sedimenti TaxID=2320865 RepID=A0A3A3GMC1_9BURK|nr:DUF1109 domain-containing protein [Noviherbaspirillum sedimenti]RJG03446.1 DUF1109 domain-containing protein [Noviherbaspirillum sedimenti]
MKTDELVDLLVRSATPVERHAAARRFALALAWGLSGAALAMLLFLGVRPDIAAAARLPMFWVKLGFPALVAAVALYAAARLARPGMHARHAAALLLALLAAIWLPAALALLGAPPARRAALVFGDTWLSCLVSIPLLSIPAFAGVLWAIKGLAPTRLRQAGAAAGLLAGAVSAAVYALHCPELAVPFLASWYVLGMAIPAAAGGLLGPRLLRW